MDTDGDSLLSLDEFTNHVLSIAKGLDDNAFQVLLKGMYNMGTLQGLAGSTPSAERTQVNTCGLHQ